MLIQLLYVSQSNLSPDPLVLEREVSQILSTSFINNERDGVTGLLLYAGGIFCQLMEGEEAAVDAAFNRVQIDHRHRDVKVLMRQTVDWLLLPKFPMGCAGIEREADALMTEASQLRGWTQISEAAPAVLDALLKRVPDTDLVRSDPNVLLGEDLSL